MAPHRTETGTGAGKWQDPGTRVGHTPRPVPVNSFGGTFYIPAAGVGTAYQMLSGSVTPEAWTRSCIGADNSEAKRREPALPPGPPPDSGLTSRRAAEAQTRPACVCTVGTRVGS